MKKILLILPVLFLLVGCAYKSSNLMEVKAKKYKKTAIGFTCENCEVTISRRMDTRRK